MELGTGYRHFIRFHQFGFGYFRKISIESATRFGYFWRMYCTSWFFYWSKWLACKKIRKKYSSKFFIQPRYQSKFTFSMKFRFSGLLWCGCETSNGLGARSVGDFSLLSLCFIRISKRKICAVLHRWRTWTLEEQLRTHRATVWEFSALIFKISLTNM